MGFLQLLVQCLLSTCYWLGTDMGESASKVPGLKEPVPSREQIIQNSSIRQLE